MSTLKSPPSDSTEPIPRLGLDAAFDDAAVAPPPTGFADFPERVLQFGTGAFLRGFTEAFVDEANRAGRFAGRVVMVGSTGSGRSDTLGDQDHLYTLCIRGLNGGRQIDECRVIGSVSRALSASDEWDRVLELATRPDLEVIVSNTTEVGIQLLETDRPDANPPESFPGKLAAFLARRAEAFDCDPARGVVILPCELIDDNGDRLREIVRKLIRNWSLSARVERWILESNTFCNTLVDCIVTGFPAKADYEVLVERLGYEDLMLTIAEPYRLWAIEGDDAVREKLAFLEGLPGVCITDDIHGFRERKVRILNGAHSLMVPISMLCANATVLETMEDQTTSRFVRDVILNEIVPGLPGDTETARSFALEVIERYANPFIRHELKNIALQQTSKVRVRVLPSIERYQALFGHVPPLTVFGIAALAVFKRNRIFEAESVLPSDDADDAWRALFHAEPADAKALARAIAADEPLWGRRLDAFEGFTAVLADCLESIDRLGPREALAHHLSETSRRFDNA
jgi:tagaturonate reductase